MRRWRLHQLSRRLAEHQRLRQSVHDLRFTIHGFSAFPFPFPLRPLLIHRLSRAPRRDDVHAVARDQGSKGATIGRASLLIELLNIVMKLAQRAVAIGSCWERGRFARHGKGGVALALGRAVNERASNPLFIGSIRIAASNKSNPSYLSYS